MRNVSASSEDLCRSRYDRINFARERCQDGGDVKEASKERRWLLELGAMTLLEAELETISVSTEAMSAAGRNETQRGRGDQDTGAYQSCLGALLEGHYDALGELGRNGRRKSYHARTRRYPL